MPQAVVIGVIVSLAITVAITALQIALTPRPKTPQPRAPEKPTSDDGKFNLRQNVPSLSVVLGRVKKGGDFAFVGEKNGSAYLLTVLAGHRVEGFVEHWLHDELVTLNDDAEVTEPAHFDERVVIRNRRGLNAETAFNSLVNNFPTLWSEDHRGDGLAQVLMVVRPVAEERFLDTFPQQMPQHTAVLDGALLYDPRDGSTAFSQNVALFRLHHLLHPAGGRLALENIYLPDWRVAADVCDELVTRRDGVQEARYWGGWWYRYENDPVEIGRTLDEAGDLVLYERADGTIGVHAGRYVSPDIRITPDDILSLKLDVNRRQASTVLAVRGRFVDPAAQYNTVDAAIFGDPYQPENDSERTSTVDNQVVQSHNLCQRLQKLRMTRANAARVSVVVPWLANHPTRQIPFRRFIRVHYPARGLDEAVIELSGRPRMSLRDLTLSFDGIVVPDSLYAFDAATEEGEPPVFGEAGPAEGVPVPTGFAIEMQAGTLRAVATWTPVDSEDADSLTYELEWQKDDLSEPPVSLASKPGETAIVTGILTDGVGYNFRLRTLSNGATSAWTAYINLVAVADPVAPGVPTDFASTISGSDVTLYWVNPNSANFHAAQVWRSNTNDFSTAILMTTLYGGPGLAKSWVDAVIGGSSLDYFWWVRSINASGTASAPVGPETHFIA